ncbi:MAG: bifunctional phosphopantothenoylcysteine decarboxylase/phosphopantothenate synthase [Novosphingobium sp.]|uniref:bifunctional phosphopantothenoylcysteine decarboxylase/phosphopantothenate synthase n=1 Tax=Novosphingobium sp. TaxID=1874826 RepID=UPI002628ABCC|nr:bifunctional phosphopantothenoylcysteine decarboxylase/phosphopantothenate synthase [Novosphingobium sp.]MCP5385781.1 bifunctional phosphopantothenoylcysteine decarboxylase/phosphopantothenate synthase [Novosphingobium sp.]
MSVPRILLVVGGGIAAYKACELIRLIRKGGGEVTCVLTAGGAKFITPMTLAALSENPVHTTLWDLANEVEMGHIQLSREADLVVVCPATADLLAKMAQGIADDLATTLLLATDKPVLAVPAMNVKMWEHSATQANVATLVERGVLVMEPDEGPMACGEFGAGRLPEPQVVYGAICHALGLEVPLLPAPALPIDGEEPGLGDISGLGGLSSGLVKRSTPPLRAEPEDAEFEDAILEDLPEYAELVAPDDIPPPEELLASPILSKKGKAKAAPPTDPEAINHEVTGALPPEPFAGDSAADLTADPLAGQPDFAPDEPRPPQPPFDGPLKGKHVLVTAGPTHEPIDPVRYIANRSSGKQGYAIAAAAARAGAKVTLVSGPVALATPPGVNRVDVETAREMADAVKRALPADVAIMVAAVADWRTLEAAPEKMKKRGSAPPALRLTENPDILASVAVHEKRPKLVVGFAAETEQVIDHAKEKRKRKGADWIVANDVSGDVMGGNANAVHIVSDKGVESLPEMPKDEVAAALVERIADALVKSGSRSR